MNYYGTYPSKKLDKLRYKIIVGCFKRKIIQSWLNKVVANRGKLSFRLFLVSSSSRLVYQYTCKQLETLNKRRANAASELQQTYQD